MAEQVKGYADWNVYRKLAKARVMLQSKKLKKSGQNKFAGFSYFELADFLPAVNEIFDELGLFAQFRIEDEYDEVVDSDTGLIIHQPACAYLRIRNCDKDGEEITFSSGIADAGTKGASPIQQLGSVHTYMRRYLYMEALEIVESDGLDALNGTDKIEQKPAEKTARAPRQAKVDVKPMPCTQAQQDAIKAAFQGNEQRLQDMMAAYRITNISQLTVKQAEAVINRMKGEAR